MSSLITSSPNKQRKNRFTPPQSIEILLIHQSPKFVIEIKKTVVHTGDGRSLPSGVSRTDGDAATPPRPVVPTRAPRHPRVRLPFRRSGNPLEFHRVQTRIRKASGTHGAHRKGLRLTCRSSAGLHQPKPQIGCAARHALGADFFCGGPSHG